MKLDVAIGILSKAYDVNIHGDDYLLKDAVRLGIEALKAIKKLRVTPSLKHYDQLLEPLPGETK